MKLLLTCPKQFRHLVSAMVYVGTGLDKEAVLRDLRIGYAGQIHEPDPVVWIREVFKDPLNFPKGIFIRTTFTARTYQELKPG